MYLKSVDIVGFKSFADKTHLEFKPGITGVIGPNGCGKSNVQEAIRWCIGEMSWKSLRSNSMVDVIFAGTAKRNPMSMAEVTLTFDNASGKLPVQFSEITVTRRLFRSGESEYYLNRTQCRLRDIKELFLDTGIGGDGYAIIDQGGVDFVLSAKPEDRRALFEEAAGVSKYKAKREEALRKLERVEIDLARLNDSMAMINEQIKKLDSDARKAKLYQKYKEELAAMEAGQMLQEMSSIRSELEKESGLMAPVQELLGQKRAEASAEEARLSALLLERTELEAQAAASNEAIASVKAELVRLEERLSNNQVMRSDLGGRRQEALAALSKDTERSVALDPEIDRAQAALEQAANKELEARQALGDFEGEAQAFQAKLSEAQAEAQARTARCLEATQAVVEAHNTSSSLRNRRSHAELELKQALKELGRQEEKVQACRAEIDARQAEAEAQRLREQAGQQEVSQAESRLQAEIARKAELEEKIFSLRADAVRVEAKIEAVQAQGSQDAYWVGAQAAANAGIPGILGTLSSLLRVDPAFASRLEDVLGERLYSVVCEDVAAAKSGIEFLRAAGKGRARFLVLSAFAEGAAPPVIYPPEARPLAERVSFDPRVERAGTALLAECYVVGDALFGDHWVCGGADMPETAPRLSDIGALSAEATGLRQRQSEFVSIREATQAAIAEAGAALKQASESHRQDAAKLHALEASLSQRRESLGLLEQEAELCRNEAARLQEDITSLEREIVEAEEQGRRRQETEREFKALQAEAEARIQTLGAEASELQMRRHRLESSLELLATHRAVAQKEFDRLVVEKETLEQDSARRRGELEAIESRLAECDKVELDSRQQSDAGHRRLAELEGAAQQLHSRLLDMTQRAQALQQSLRALQESCAQAQDQLHQWEIKESGLKAREQSLKGRLWDEWQLTWEEASAKYAQQAVDGEKLQFLRRRIQSLGNVNMAAPEEYEALNQKHGFLNSQIDDLSKAKEDLRAAIGKINATTRENFRQTFTEVREHFRTIYAALFEGGEADLVLTDQENLLETGIEIVAQPPGKRLQSVTLLSGGEKTLTAIALLFAFFMVKPSPVCMLDEADAALDEANTERFAGMLKEFSHQSQFLVISHSKRTMEAADQIYGVTMEESGISQIISVDFKKKSASETAPEASAPAEPLV